VFADILTERINSKKSILCAGFDPTLEAIPEFIFKNIKADSEEKLIKEALTSFISIALDSVKDFVSCIKPNTAFFEQYGFSGLKALSFTLGLARQLNIPSIVDAKRGDIGNTALAYAKAYLSGTKTPLRATLSPFVGDSITVSPFLGFDTAEPFIEACKNGKGVFILVKTSNPGSGDIQGVKGESETISEKIAHWVAKEGSKCLGKSGYSNLCAVVGGTYPEELKSLRVIMPNTIFLIPGFGAQGASASDVRQALDKRGGGIVCNASRGLFGSIPPECSSKDLLVELFRSRAQKFRDELNCP